MAAQSSDLVSGEPFSSTDGEYDIKAQITGFDNGQDATMVCAFYYVYD